MSIYRNLIKLNGPLQAKWCNMSWRYISYYSIGSIRYIGHTPQIHRRGITSYKFINYEFVLKVCMYYVFLAFSVHKLYIYIILRLRHIIYIPCNLYIFNEFKMNHLDLYEMSIRILSNCSVHCLKRNELGCIILYFQITLHLQRNSFKLQKE